MAQTGVVAFGIYLTLLQISLSASSTKGLTTLFTLAEHVEFFSMVAPGETVIIQGEKIYFRAKSIKSRISL